MTTTTSWLTRILSPPPVRQDTNTPEVCQHHRRRANLGPIVRQGTIETRKRAWDSIMARAAALTGTCTHAHRLSRARTSRIFSPTSAPAVVLPLLLPVAPPAAVLRLPRRPRLRRRKRVS